MIKRGEILQSKVLAVLRHRNSPLSAYDILEVLRKDNPKIAPPTIYRALSALTEDGKIHRIESLNAYFACQHDSHQHTPVMSICDNCGTVSECSSTDIPELLSNVVSDSGFSPERHVIEVHGVCSLCGAEKSVA